METVLPEVMKSPVPMVPEMAIITIWRRCRSRFKPLSSALALVMSSTTAISIFSMPEPTGAVALPDALEAAELLGASILSMIYAVSPCVAVAGLRDG